MIRFGLTSILAAGLSLILTTEAFSQRPGGGGIGRNMPKVGERLPDVSGYDVDGRPVSLRDLKGDYKVLVFGCLT